MQTDIKEILENILLPIPELRDYGDLNALDRPEALSPQQIMNAIDSYAPGVEPEDIVAILDCSIFNTGKEGVMFTTTGFAYDSLYHYSGPDKKHPMPIPYAELAHVSLKGTNLQLHYCDGSVNTVYGGNYSYGIAKAINRILDELYPSQTEMIPPIDATTSLAVDGSVDAQFDLAIFYDNDGDPAEAAKWYEKAAQLGNVEAQRIIAMRYSRGEGVNRDMGMAAYWFQQAALAGSASAQYNLAVLYHKGDGADQNTEQALYWLEQAAAQGHEKAQIALDQLRRQAQLRAEAESARYQQLQQQAQLDDYTELWGNRDRMASDSYNASEQAPWAPSVDTSDFNDSQMRDAMQHVQPAADAEEPAYTPQDDYADDDYQPQYPQLDFPDIPEISYSDAPEEEQSQEPDASSGMSDNSKEMAESMPVQQPDTNDAAPNISIGQLSSSVPSSDAQAPAHDVYTAPEAEDQQPLPYAGQEGQKVEPGVTQLIGKISFPQESYADLETRAASGDTKAMVELSLRLNRGDGVKQNNLMSIAWMVEAAEHDDPEAKNMMDSLDAKVIFESAKNAYEKKQYYVADYLFRACALCGVPNSYYYLGQMAAEGRETEKNASKALRLFLRGANAGDAQCQLTAARWYDKGGVVQADLETAAYWFEKAAEQGLTAAEVEIGSRYLDGTGVTPDVNKAIYWWEKAAQKGIEQIQYNLGVLYGTGSMIPKDIDKAMLWLEKSAAQGNEKAKYHLDELKKQIASIGFETQFIDLPQINA